MTDPESTTSRLLEQLMQIARTSALEEMASGFAHELNQPIGAIATFAQAAERMLSRPEPMTAQALDVLRHISNAMPAKAFVAFVNCSMTTPWPALIAPCPT
jgi:C4-dicarboxylate-specific signal transduction histidine kinase